MSRNLTRRTLSWGETSQLVDRLTHQLERHYDALLMITRGGMVPACLISERMDIRNIMVAAVAFSPDEAAGELRFLQFPQPEMLRGKRVLIVDDVWDSGETIVSARDRVLAAEGEVDVAVLHYKPDASRYPDTGPDYVAESTTDWIVYPWDGER